MLYTEEEIVKQYADEVKGQIAQGLRWQGLIGQPLCSRCPLRYDVKVYPDGPIPARMAFVGEGPGGYEVTNGVGLCGPTGQLLWKLTSFYGYDRTNAWISNAALCRPRKVQLSTGVTLPIERVKWLSVQCCRPRLHAELEHVLRGVNGQRPVIVPLGNLAMKMITNRPLARIMKYRGSIMEYSPWKHPIK